ncbi:hypothetical protein JF535_04205 [Microbulbifer salipaludis]|uniref:DUF4239 domain-containing protein n=1 Tax=Microbulbifer salipaludis TaxID=187980 RepID=A0ABS3E477_9GAMM|nr:hypothetical protein [Microbulbifer salipaludis]MBN8430052.1 hypothetical protein [Microbulbifer salipaludis]
MAFTDSLNQLSLPVFGGLSVLLVLVAMFVGSHLGLRSVRNGNLSDASIGSAVAAILGLLAFLLAFTFNSTAERFIQRKALLLDEVNAISTTYLRADLLPLQQRREARALLAEYATLRDIDPTHTESLPQLLARSKAIHEALWNIVAELNDAQYDAVRLGKFLDSLNTVIDFNTSRIYVGSRYRIPTPMWGALALVTALAMFGIGFQLGAGRRGSLQINLALAFSFSIVILLIADLDRAAQGWLIIDQAPMSELSQELQEAERKAAP